MDLLERAIAAFSPAAGLRRAAARAALEGMKHQRSYDGARVGRKKGALTAQDLAPDRHLADLRRGARHLYRNSTYTRAALRVLVTDQIGSGWMAGFSHIPGSRRGQRKKLEDEWRRWCAVADFRGRLSFDAQTKIAAHTMNKDGEVLIRFRRVPWRAGDPVPLRLEMLPIDYLSQQKSGSRGVFDGIEYDSDGRATAYWLDPAMGNLRDFGMLARDPIRVEAGEMIHLFDQEDPIQWRGVTRLAAAMQRLSDLEEFEEARLLQAKISACFAVFVENSPMSNGISPSLGQPIQGKGPREELEALNPGLIAYMNPGETAKVAQPTKPELGNYVTDHIRAIAAGVGVMYEHIASDLSQVNFSSYKAGHIPYRASVEQTRWLTLQPQLFGAVYAEWARLAVLCNIPLAEDYSPVWTPPAFQSIDRGKDAEADALELQNGTITLEQLILERGRTVEEHLSSAEASKLIRETLRIAAGTTEPDPKPQA